MIDWIGVLNPFALNGKGRGTVENGKLGERKESVDEKKVDRYELDVKRTEGMEEEKRKVRLMAFRDYVIVCIPSILHPSRALFPRFFRSLCPHLDSHHQCGTIIQGPISEELVFRSCVISTYQLSNASWSTLVFGTPFWFGIGTC